MEKLTDLDYENAIEDYINEGINWEATSNPVIQAGYDDVAQFARDSFHAGIIFMMRKYGIEFAPNEEDA